MTVYVVVKRHNKGVIAGVFNTLKAASTYITKHPYEGFIIEECVVQLEKAESCG